MSTTVPDDGLPAAENLRATLLFSIMNEDFKGSVVTHVLNHKNRMADSVSKQLELTFNKELKIPQFPRFPERAPPGMLKQAILEGIYRSDALATAVLKTWCLSRRSLHDRVVDHLYGRDAVGVSTNFGENLLTGYWSFQDWNAERDKLMESNAELDEDEVALMLCCITGKMPVSSELVPEEEDTAMDENPRDNALEQALDYLEQLPADAPEWESTVPTFLSSVADLSEAKKNDREFAVSREALESVLSNFLNTYTDKLKYFDLAPFSWHVPIDCDPSDVSEIEELLGNLTYLVDEYFSIPDKGSSLSETQRLNAQRDDVHLQIQDVKSDLDRMLIGEGGSDDPPAADPDPDAVETTEVSKEPAEDHSPSTDATLADLQLGNEPLAFDPRTISYPIPLENSVDSLYVTPLVSDEGAIINVSVQSPDQTEQILAERDGGAYFMRDIAVGQTRIVIMVTAEDGETCQTYSLSVTRAPSSDATLESMESSVGDLEFSPDELQYSIAVPDGIDSLRFGFKTTHDAASVSPSLEFPDGTSVGVNRPDDGEVDVSDLPEGQSVLSLAVTAQDSLTGRIYRINLTRDSREVIDHMGKMWGLVAQDDLAGAYWISKSLAAQGQISQDLPLLLRSVQGSRWHTPDSMDLVVDLSNAVTETAPPFDNQAFAMLALAAAIEPSVTAPETNLLGWLVSPGSLPSLEGVVSPIRNYANWGYALRPEHVQGDEGHRRLQSLIEKASSEAERWLEESDKRFHNFVRANNVLRHLCSDGGILKEMLKTVANDHRRSVASVRSDAEALKSDTYRNEVINEADRLLLGSIPKSAIAGAANLWLQRWISEAADFAERWCDLVDRAKQVEDQAQNRWLAEQVSELRTQVELGSRLALDELDGIASDSDQADLASSAKCLASSIRRILAYLDIDDDTSNGAGVARTVADMQRIALNVGQGVLSGGSGGSLLESALSKRLLWTPIVEFGDDGLPLDTDSPIDLSQIEETWYSTDLSAESAIRLRINSGDFRFLTLLSSTSVTSQSVDLEPSYSGDLTAAKETLTEDLKATREEVEQAANDGVIEFEGAEWNKFTNTLDDILVDEVLNFKKVHDDLDEIRTSLKKERTKRRAELVSEWRRTLDQLPSENTSREVELLEVLTATFKMASRDDSLDIRVMEDCATRLRSLQSGESRDVYPVRPASALKTLEVFLTYSRGVSDRQAFMGDGRELRNLIQQAANSEV